MSLSPLIIIALFFVGWVMIWSSPLAKGPLMVSLGVAYGLAFIFYTIGVFYG